jgi:hypothetical protein
MDERPEIETTLELRAAAEFSSSIFSVRPAEKSINARIHR